jgi:cobalt-zinc-cadmium efflux system membrane fusion protein
MTTSIQFVARAGLLAILASLFVACGRPSPAGHDDHDRGHADAASKGPHGGRLLAEGLVAVEVTIFERGVPPEFRVYLYRDGKPLPPEQGRVAITLARLGGVVDTHAFAPAGEYLRSDAEVYEPHSFDVEVRARVAGTDARWAYASHEGRTRITAAAADGAGIRVKPAGPATIRDEHEVQGLIAPVEGRRARVMARFPGVVREVRASTGERVAAGAVLALVESNESLQRYAVAAPFAGTVLARDASVGELTGSAPLFEVADLSRVWVDLHVFGADAEHLAAGHRVRVERLTDGVVAETAIDLVLPATATASQSTIARATLDNADGRWRPGAAVRARITVAEREAALTVPLTALQRFRDWDAVFIRVGDEYEVRPLELGERDATRVEVLAGLKPGDAVVVEQSFLIRADIEKSGASHDH